MRSPSTPFRVLVSHLASTGATTEAELTAKLFPPAEGLLDAEPVEGARLEVWRGGRRALRTTPIERVEAGAGRTWRVWTKHSIYRVRRLD